MTSLKSSGAVLRASPADVTVMRRRLIRAGIKGDSALSILYGSKVLLGVAFPLGMAMLVAGSAADSSNKMLAIGAAAVAGFWAQRVHQDQGPTPSKGDSARSGQRLDLLVVCVESGLGLDQAIVQVAKELAHAHREISDEFAFVTPES
jgi:tight adherence protein C